MPDEPSLERHFVRASLLGLLRRGHPYDFVETYRVVQALYGYRAWYVNLGLWPGDGEPGRALAERVAAPLMLAAGERLIEVGSGLGQAAIDLCQRHALGSVLGVNVNPRQVAFANELAAAAGLGDRIAHVVGDASEHLRTLPAASAHGVLAIECAGHFADPRAFLGGARHVLVRGRRLAFCLNVLDGVPDALDRVLMRASFGFVPAPAAEWRARLAAAGFEDIREEDLTGEVTTPMCAAIEARSRAPTDEVRALPWSARTMVRVLNKRTAAAVRSGHLRYALFSAEAP